MKVTMIVLSVLTGILVFSTVVCGLWIRSSGDAADASSIRFHMTVGLASVFFAVVTIFLSVRQVFVLM